MKNLIRHFHEDGERAITPSIARMTFHIYATQPGMQKELAHRAIELHAPAPFHPQSQRISKSSNVSDGYLVLCRTEKKRKIPKRCHGLMTQCHLASVARSRRLFHACGNSACPSGLSERAYRKSSTVRYGTPSLRIPPVPPRCELPPRCSCPN